MDDIGRIVTLLPGFRREECRDEFLDHRVVHRGDFSGRATVDDRFGGLFED
jgi:hypothetical protein